MREKKGKWGADAGSAAKVGGYEGGRGHRATGPPAAAPTGAAMSFSPSLVPLPTACPTRRRQPHLVPAHNTFFLATPPAAVTTDAAPDERKAGAGSNAAAR